MLSCLIEVDSTVEVIYDGVVQCLLQYRGSSYQDISPGSRGDSTLIILEKLIDVKADFANYDDSGIFHGHALVCEENYALLCCHYFSERIVKK
jgi:hypothetical protein